MKEKRNDIAKLYNKFFDNQNCKRVFEEISKRLN